jgi:hypothetical protein
VSHETKIGLAALKEVQPKGLTAEQIAASEHNDLPQQVEARHIEAALSTAPRRDGIALAVVDGEGVWYATDAGKRAV